MGHSSSRTQDTGLPSETNVMPSKTSGKWHTTYPFLNGEDYEEYKDDEEELRRLNNRSKSKCEKKFEKYTLTVNSRKRPPRRRLPGIRIAMVGKTGHGKSATANTLMGSEQFCEGASTKSVTETSSIKTCRLGGNRKLTVMDSPGMEDTHRPEKEILDEVFRVGFLLREGVNCFIYCLNAMSHRFTAEDERVLKALQSKFGKRFIKHCLIVYTNVESKVKDGETLDSLCQHQREHEGVDELLTKIGWKVVAVDNKSDIPAERQRNQKVLIDMIDWVVESNSYEPYQNAVCKKANMLFNGLSETAVKKGWHPSLLTAVIEVVTSSTSASYSNEGEFIRAVTSVIENSNLGNFESGKVRLHSEHQTKTISMNEFKESIKAIYHVLHLHLQIIRKVLVAHLAIKEKMQPELAIMLGHVLWATLICGTPDTDEEDD